MRLSAMKKLGLGSALIYTLLLAAKPRASAQEPAPGCEKRPELECFETRGCVLECTSKEPKTCAPYRCRNARGPCESTYAQKELTRANCMALSGCIYDEAFCFCPGPMECYCGGGKPATCETKH